MGEGKKRKKGDSHTRHGPSGKEKKKEVLFRLRKGKRERSSTFGLEKRKEKKGSAYRLLRKEGDPSNKNAKPRRKKRKNSFQLQKKGEGTQGLYLGQEMRLPRKEKGEEKERTT